MTFDDARRLALLLPEATEEPYHGGTSFRVRKKVFATAADDLQLNIMLPPDESDEALASGLCEELWWGAKRFGIRVTLADVDLETITEWLRWAWLAKAPRRLIPTLP